MNYPMVNHLFVTERFLVKGQVETGELRLSNFLNNYKKPMLQVEDITMIDLRSGDRVVAASARSPRRESGPLDLRP